MNTNKNKLLSIIIPAYNEQDMIPITHKTVGDCMKANNIPYEIIFINDGSNDATFNRIEDLVNRGFDDVKGISFSRNFGKEAAIMAGLNEAAGACCVVMDCDLQHPVEIVPQMYSLWEQGYEVVEGVKADRGKESAIHRGFAKLFYNIISDMSNIDMRDTSDFKLLDRVAIDTLIAMPERSPFFRGLSQWIGFKSTRISFEVADRQVGESKWSPVKLIQYAIHNICVFSSKPMHIVTWLGVIFIAIGLISAIESLIRYFMGTAAEGFTTVICLLFISCGVIMISLGIIGYYIAQIYEEIKARPRYIISQRCMVTPETDTTSDK